MKKKRSKHIKTQKKVENDEKWGKTTKTHQNAPKHKKYQKKVKNEKKTTKTHQNTTKS